MGLRFSLELLLSSLMTFPSWRNWSVLCQNLLMVRVRLLKQELKVVSCGHFLLSPEDYLRSVWTESFTLSHLQDCYTVYSV